jgi:para-nitrobenzyl esterase
MVVGSCRDEVSIFGEVDHNVDIALPASFEGGGKDQPPMLASKAGFSELAKAIGSDIGAAVRARRSEYPNEKEEAVVVALLSDLLFRRPAIKLAEARAKYGQAATFVYQINWSSPLLPELGACHSIGVSLFFRNEERVACARGDVSASSLARRMANALASFMRDGDPNCEGLPYWGAYSPDKRQVMLFEEPPVVEVDPQGALRQAWDEIQPDFPLV